MACIDQRGLSFYHVLALRTEYGDAKVDTNEGTVSATCPLKSLHEGTGRRDLSQKFKLV